MAAWPVGVGAAASVSVPHERTSVRLVRHAMADQLAAAGVGSDDRDDAMLVLSELVSNAVQHAAPLPSGEIGVRWEVRDDLLHIEITDGGAGSEPHASAAALSALGGRGLDIVRTVSAQWGVTEGQDSVTVWAEVPRSSTPDAERPEPAPGAGAADLPR
jgi:anti-sigma regulatory factor (Ser/Thr protein kinase)